MAAVKICGAIDESAIRAIIAAKADYAGFVYYPPSPRHLSFEHMNRLAALLPATIQSVCVMVDPDDDLIAQVKTSHLQLHGKETPERVRDIKNRCPGVKIIKAIAVRSGDDIAQAMRYGDSADMLLFDAKPSENMLPGGNGLSFDWALLKGREFPLPWMLSGGLSADNVADAVTASGARMVDVSSSVEASPGVKDPTLIDAFVKAARRL
jgi:phosphoribosylanthranilate isomerase